MNGFLITICLVVFSGIFYLGFFLYSRQDLEFKKKYGVFSKEVLSLNAAKTKALEVNQVSINLSRWNGNIGSFYIQNEFAILSFSRTSPLKLYFGFKSFGMRIPLHKIDNLDENTGFAIDGYQIKFSPNIHLSIKKSLGEL